jgi:hypothetical protein
VTPDELLEGGTLEVFDADEARSAIFQALGAASVCWDNLGDAVFDPDRCREIGDDLCRKLGIPPS